MSRSRQRDTTDREGVLHGQRTAGGRGKRRGQAWHQSTVADGLTTHGRSTTPAPVTTFRSHCCQRRGGVNQTGDDIPDGAHDLAFVGWE
jgi:hypothetical protein